MAWGSGSWEADVLPGASPDERGEQPLLGRDPELRGLAAALEGAIAGRAQLLLLTGEPGIGKTRLADALGTEARRRGAAVAWGRCWEGGGAPAYWPWTQSLRGVLRDLDPERLRAAMGPSATDLAAILPDLAGGGQPEPAPVGAAGAETSDARFRLFTTVAAFLREAGGQRPVVVVLEDLHAADLPSLLLLRFVADDVSAARVLILGTHRDAELGPDDPRATALADLARSPIARRMTPRALTAAEVARYIEDAAGGRPAERLAELVHAQTEGNPLFVAETVRLLAEEGRLRSPSDVGPRGVGIPEGVRTVIGRRIARLSDPCRGLLSQASAIGTEFGLDLLEPLAGAPPEQLFPLLDEAAVARVIAPVGGVDNRWRFAHALFREVLYDGLPALTRIKLHATAAEALEAIVGDEAEQHLAVLAHHFARAAPVKGIARAVEYAGRAARRAIDLTAYEEAARLYRLALDVLAGGPPDDVTRCRLLNGLGRAEARAGDRRAAQAAFLEAAGLAEQLGLVEELAEAAFGYGGRFIWARRGTDERIVPLLETALARLSEDDSVLRVRLLSRLAGALRDEPDPARRDALSREAGEMARRLGNSDALFTALLARFTAIMAATNLDEMVATAAELQQLADASIDRELRADAPWMGFIIKVSVGAPGAEIRGALNRYVGLVRDLQQPALTWYLGNMRTIVALLEGRLEDAEATIAETLERGRLAQTWETEFSYVVSTFALRREQDRLPELGDLIERAIERMPGYPLLRALQIHLDAAIGHREAAALALTRHAGDGLRWLPPDAGQLYGLVNLGEAALLLDDLSTARRVADELAPFEHLVATASGETSAGPVALVLGRIALLEGRPDEAVRLLSASQATSERMGARLWVVHSRVALAAALLARGRDDDATVARRHLDWSVGVARSLGLILIERRAREVLGRDGPGHPAEVAAHPSAPAATLPATFRREGDVWTISYHGKAIQLVDAKGLAYLALLLASPGRPMAALDLVSALNGRGTAPSATAGIAADALRPGTGTAGDDVLDAEARAAYRERLIDLQEEIDEAEAMNDPERAARAREEQAFLARELAAATGLGGRTRTAPSEAERARQSVGKAIREAIRRIDEHDPALGRHLTASVTTGTFCSYDPDPAALPSWRL